MSNSNETPLPHEIAAHDLIKHIQALILERVPDLNNVPTAQRRRLTAAANVPDDFLETVAATVDTTPEIGAPSRLTGVVVRDVITFSRVYLTFADRLEEIVHGIRATVAARRHDVGQRALGVYGMAKCLNRPNATPLVPSLPSMRRTLGRARRRKAAETPPEEVLKTK